MVGVQGVLRRHARTVREAAERREAPVHGEDPGQEHAPNHDPKDLEKHRENYKLHTNKTLSDAI